VKIEDIDLKREIINHEESKDEASSEI